MREKSGTKVPLFFGFLGKFVILYNVGHRRRQRLHAYQAIFPVEAQSQLEEASTLYSSRLSNIRKKMRKAKKCVCFCNKKISVILFGIVGNFVILYNVLLYPAAWLGFFRRQVLKEIYLHFFAEIFG